VHFINANNFLLTQFSNTIFHTLVHNNVSYTLQLSKQQFYLSNELHAKCIICSCNAWFVSSNLNLTRNHFVVTYVIIKLQNIFNVYFNMGLGVCWQLANRCDFATRVLMLALLTSSSISFYTETKFRFGNNSAMICLLFETYWTTIYRMLTYGMAVSFWR